jgi:chromosome partitioning protein
MAKIIAFSNQKGGVGKTTSCVNMAAGIALQGKRVLLIDYDAQGNATSGVGVDKRTAKHSIYDVIAREVPIRDAVIKTAYDNLWLIPSKIDLAASEIELGANLSKGINPLDAIRELDNDFDYILIDCPPSLGFLTVSALSVADGVLIPMQCEFFALEGLSQLLPTIRRIRQTNNPALQVVGILPTMYNGRLTLTRQVIDEIKRYYPNKLFRTPISRSVRLSTAPSYGMPIQYMEPKGKCAEEYNLASLELMQRI